MANNMVSEIQFKYNPELVEQYGDYKTYVEKQKNLLKTTPAWDLYNKAKAEYEQATKWFNSANAAFQQLRSEKNTAKAKYNNCILEYKKQNGADATISSAQKSDFIRQSGYTTDLINNTNDAEIQADLALDARFAAVDSQRRGLYFSV